MSEKEQSFYDAYENFFEELTNHEDRFQENLDITDPDSYQGGLTKENVSKLTDDLMNPLPPVDPDNRQ